MPNDAMAVTVRQVDDFEQALPPEARLLIESYSARAKSEAKVVVPMVPATVNNQYRTNKRRMGQFYDLDPRIKVLRDLTRVEVLRAGLRWQPVGVVAAVLIFESPHWVTQKLTISRSDVDNKVKAMVDALDLALGFSDQRVWAGHQFKLQGERDRSHCWLFELGELVDQYKGPR
jgi:Holliday junction resolvase RusA-like endonuclease